MTKIHYFIAPVSSGRAFAVVEGTTNDILKEQAKIAILEEEAAEEVEILEIGKDELTVRILQDGDEPEDGDERTYELRHAAIYSNPLTELEARAQFVKFGIVEAFWSEEDVIGRAKDEGVYLTEKQVEAAVYQLGHDHDAEHGINWDTIDYAVECQIGMYPHDYVQKHQKNYSTGRVHTWAEFIETEIEERGNYDQDDIESWIDKAEDQGVTITDTSRVVWVSPLPHVAAAYSMDASDRDRAEEIYNADPEAWPVDTYEGGAGYFIVESHDGEDGYLLVLNG